MNGVEELVSKVITSLTIKTGKWMLDGLERFCNLNIVKAAEILTNNPDDDNAKKILVGKLKKAIEESPSLAQDLRNVLLQSASIKGDHNKVIQVQGDNNRT